jgi:chemotaxis response regulator CheB
MNEDSMNPYYVAIGASGGEGLTDLGVLLRSWPAFVPAVVMIVLHRPADKASHLREILGRSTHMPVTIASETEHLQTETVYIGEPDQHLTLLENQAAGLVEGIAHQYRNRTIDLLFNSLALHARERSVGIVFSGSLDDGSRGLAAIHAAGGVTMVLDPGDKPVGMQQNAIDFDGPITFVGTAAGIGEAVVRIVEHRSDQEKGRSSQVRESCVTYRKAPSK